MQPRQIRDTLRPVLPRLTYSIRLIWVRWFGSLRSLQIPRRRKRYFHPSIACSGLQFRNQWITAGFHLFAVLCERPRFQSMIAQKQGGRFRLKLKRRTKKEAFFQSKISKVRAQTTESYKYREIHKNIKPCRHDDHRSWFSASWYRPCRSYHRSFRRARKLPGQLSRG
jgi:hypothetical protein